VCNVQQQPILWFGESNVVTFLLAWFAVSVVGTLIALAVIRSGKRRQPEPDDVEVLVPHSHTPPAAPLKA
jgi:cation transporter-like permease